MPFESIFPWVKVLKYSILNMVHVNFVSKLFNLPLKTEENPRNPFTEKQMYDILALLFGYVFLDKDEVQSFKIRKLGLEACEALSTLVKFNVKGDIPWRMGQEISRRDQTGWIFG